MKPEFIRTLGLAIAVLVLSFITTRGVVGSVVQTATVSNVQGANLVFTDARCNSFSLSGTAATGYTLRCDSSATATSGPGSTQTSGSTAANTWSGSCPGFDHTYVVNANTKFDMATGNGTRIKPGDPASYPGMGPKDAIVIQFTTGSTNSPLFRGFVGGEFGASPTVRIAAISDKPCDFTGPFEHGSYMSSTMTTVFSVGPNNSSQPPTSYSYPALEYNKTYYLNIKNAQNQTCAGYALEHPESAGHACDMFIDIWPQGTVSAGNWLANPSQATTGSGGSSNTNASANGIGPVSGSLPQLTAPVTVPAGIGFAGTYTSMSQLVQAIQISHMQNCVTYRGTQIYTGFGPCYAIPSATSTQTTSIVVPNGVPFSGTYTSVTALTRAIADSKFSYCVQYQNTRIYDGFGPCYVIPQ